jgi:TolB protein
LDGSDAFLGEVGVDGTTTEPKILTPGLFRAPAVSPDGAIRAYVGARAGDLDQVVVESSDQTSHHEVSIFGFAALNFDPAGRTLGFIAADRPGLNTSGLPIGPLRVVDSATGKARTLLDGRVLAFFWAPDGKTIAALRVPDPGDGVASNAANATLAVARTGPAATASPPQAEGIDLNLSFVDVTSGKAGSQRSVHLAQTFVYQLLPYFDQYALSHRIWAPDSSAIALPLASDSATTAIFAVAADGSEPQRIADGELGFWSP